MRFEGFRPVDMKDRDLKLVSHLFLGKKFIFVLDLEGVASSGIIAEFQRYPHPYGCFITQAGSKIIFDADGEETTCWKFRVGHVEMDGRLYLED